MDCKVADLTWQGKRKLSSNESGDEQKLRKLGSKVCNYCMQEMKVEHDPRKLPCGHVFCLKCLKDDITSNQGVNGPQCNICRKVFDHTDVTSLPKGMVASELISPSKIASTSPTLYCDRCLYKPAVKYCIDCGVKSCAHHMQFHDGYYGMLHKTLDIARYAQNPTSYVKVIMCPLHRNESITMACERCYQYNCVQCDTGKKEYKAGPKYAFAVGKHIYRPLPIIRSEIKSSFDEPLQQAADKLNMIDQLEKGAQGNKEQLLADCKGMMKEVEMKSTQQIRLIQEQTAQLKEDIQQYETEKTNQVVTFMSELAMKKAEVQTAKKNTSQYIHDSHITELIKRKPEVTQMLTKVKEIDLGTCKWKNKQLCIGKKRQLEIELTSDPKSRRVKCAYRFAGYGQIPEEYNFEGLKWT